MKISLNQIDLHEAIKAFVEKAGVSLSKKKVDILIIAGRGSKGFCAEVELHDPVKEDPKETGKTSSDQQALTFD